MVSFSIHFLDEDVSPPVFDEDFYYAHLDIHQNFTTEQILKVEPTDISAHDENDVEIVYSMQSSQACK